MATENTGANENKKAGEAARKPRPADGKTPVKKKKIIIVTGNSSKSRQSSGQRSAYSSGSYSSGGTGSYTSGSGRKPRPAGQTGARRDQTAGRPRTEAKPVPHKIIRPSVKPTQMEVDYHKPEQVTRQPRRTEEPASAVSEVKAALEPVQAVPEAEPVKTAAVIEPEQKPVETVAEEVKQPVAEHVETPVQPAEPVETEKEQPASKAVSESAPEKAPKAANTEEIPARSAQGKIAEETDNRQRSGQRDRDNRGTPARDRNAQGQGGARRDNRGGDQSGARRENRSGDQGGFRRDNRSGDQGGFRRDNRSGDQGGFRRDNRSGDQGGFRRDNRSGDQSGFGGRSARPGQGPRGTGAPAAGRQGTRPGMAEGGRRRTAGRAGEGEAFGREAEKHRDDNKRKMNQERDKRSKKDFIYNEDENHRRSGNKAGKFIRPEKKVETAVEEQIKTITIPEKLTIRELAEAMHMNPSEIIKKLFLAGQIMTPNSEVEYDEAEKIALDYDILCEKEQKVDVIEELLREEEDSEEDMVTRPPVICVMGHVDHGKTSLRDKRRSRRNHSGDRRIYDLPERKKHHIPRYARTRGIYGNAYARREFH